MASIERTDRTNFNFEKHDVRAYSLSGGSYSASLDFTAADGKMLSIKFIDNEDLKEFIEYVATLGMKADWTQKYPSYYRGKGEERVTIEALCTMRDHFVNSPPVED